MHMSHVPTPGHLGAAIWSTWRSEGMAAQKMVTPAAEPWEELTEGDVQAQLLWAPSASSPGVWHPASARGLSALRGCERGQARSH